MFTVVNFTLLFRINWPYSNKNSSEFLYTIMKKEKLLRKIKTQGQTKKTFK